MEEEINEKRDIWEYVQEFVTQFGRIPKDQDELTVCVDAIVKRMIIDKQIAPILF
jgi:hypothetical protein